jgi:hypothetical protein
MSNSRFACGPLTRRAAVKILSLAAAGSAVWPSRRAPATEPAQLSEKDPAALALAYVANAAQLDIKKFPDFVKGSTCENCLQLQGKAGDSYRPCSLFPGKLVAAAGWCKSWTPEM